MHLSLNWLNDHVDLSGLDPADIAETLTMRTALIEGLVDQAAAVPAVVVGEVLECGKHPNADTLSVCKVSDGTDEVRDVVCGAPNVGAGQKIFYIPAGARLPDGTKLKKTKIRGEVSEGMICAEDELALGPEHDGILVLDDALEVGTPIAAVPGYCDVVFEIDNKSVTHRPDLWGHRGFARELAAIYGRELKPLELATSLARADVGPAIDLEDDACPLYAGLCVEGRPGRSPDWMRFRLVACGMRPIHQLVDLSNYVMLELGQPTHPFDRDRLAGDRIVVRRAGAGERIVTLDEEDRALVDTDLVIADAERPVALAGIMGGADAEVGDETTRMFLESAWFDGRVVRRTSSRIGLRSEALARFEKMLDPALVEQALQRYAWWAEQLAPDLDVAASYRVAGEAAAPRTSVHLSCDMVRARLGSDVSDERIVSVLEAIGFGIARLDDGRLDVAVPSWRAMRDVEIPEDLVEEVGRLVGYDAVPVVEPRGTLTVGARAPVIDVEDRLRDHLSRVEAALEVYAYSMVSESVLSRAGCESDASTPRLSNPLQQDAAALRPSVVPGMLSRLELWQRHGERVLTFEVGRGYSLDAGDVSERREVAVLLARDDVDDGRDVFRELRGAVARAVGALGHTVDVERSDAGAPWWHPRRHATLRVGDVVVGALGCVSPPVMGEVDARGQAAVAVLDAAALAGLPRSSGVDYRPVLRQPPARVDLAFVAPYDLTTDAMTAAIRKAGPKTLVDVEPFDVFRGESLGADKRSIAFHLVFQAAERTLTDKDVTKATGKIVAALERLGAEKR